MNARGLLAPFLLPALLAMACGVGAQANPVGVRRYPPPTVPTSAGPGERDAARGARGATRLGLSTEVGFEPVPDGSDGSTWTSRPFAPPGLCGAPQWLPLPAPSLQFHTAIHDTRRHRVIAFGGAPYAFHSDYSYYPLSNRVWMLSLDGPPVWSEVIPSGPAPSPRLGHSAVYDAVRGRMLVFGGGNNIYGAPPYLNDVWALSLEGAPVWTQLEVAGAPPPPRTGHCAIYDPIHDAMIVFGSSGAGGYEAPLNDTWSLSLSGDPTWSRLEFSGPVPPALAASSTAYAAVYAPMRRQMVMIGRGNAQSLEAWALSLESAPTWTRLATSGAPPPTRVDHSCVYDADGDRVIVFAGYASGLDLNDTWALTLTGTPAWTKLAPASSPPLPRGSHVAVYDARRHRMIVGGGWPTWEQGMDTWALSLKGRLAWSPLIDGGRPAWGRTDHTAVYDSDRERMVIYGGWSYEAQRIQGGAWTLSLAGERAWSRLEVVFTPGTFPDGRVSHSAIYDPVRERMVIFGGQDMEGRLVNDVWSLALAGAPVWTRIEVAGEGPSPRFAHRAIHDPEGNRMIVFGGRDEGAMRADVWALSLSEPPRWTELTPAEPGPAARAAYGLAYDPVGKRMLVTGGTDDFRLYPDTWALSLKGQPAWSQIEALGSPSVRRRYHSAVYDPEGERLVVWGGSSAGVYLNDAWALSLTGPPEWTEVLTANAAPEPRHGHSGLYDPGSRSMIIFGGDYDMNDTWALPLEGRQGRHRRAAELAQAEFSQAEGVAGLTLSGPRPNPSAGEAEVGFTLPQSSQVSLAVYDAAGRSVRRLAEGPYAPGAHGLRWDGRDAEGRPAPTGLYFMRLEAGGRVITRKTVIAR